MNSSCSCATSPTRRQPSTGAQRLVVAFRRPFTLGAARLYATASIGVAISSEPTDAGDLVRDADTAPTPPNVRAATGSPPSTTNYAPPPPTELRSSRSCAARWNAGNSPCGYQPEVELTTGRVKACEALLRWHHPDGTVWPAGRFVDVAEESRNDLEHRRMGAAPGL